MLDKIKFLLPYSLFNLPRVNSLSLVHSVLILVPLYPSSFRPASYVVHSVYLLNTFIHDTSVFVQSLLPYSFFLQCNYYTNHITDLYCHLCILSEMLVMSNRTSHYLPRFSWTSLFDLHTCACTKHYVIFHYLFNWLISVIHNYRSLHVKAGGAIL